LLDRIDIQIEVGAVNFDQLSDQRRGESSEEIRKRVNAARKTAQERYKKYGISCNAQLNGALTKEFCRYDESAGKLLEDAFKKLSMSARGYDRVLRMSRTIADLEGSEMIGEDHILEAIQLRSLDRKYFQ
jgi:magnesium chelatase family protein